MPDLENPFKIGKFCCIRKNKKGIIITAYCVEKRLENTSKIPPPLISLTVLTH
jgi:hypothetical protein